MIDLSRTASALAGASYLAPLWLSIQKFDGKRYNYTLRPELTWYSLTQGNGLYSVQILEPVSATQGKLLESKTLTLNLLDPNIVYLQSCVNIPWDRDMPCVRWSRGKTPRQIWEWMVDNCRYDDEQAADIIAKGKHFDYQPDITRVWDKHMGICFDMTALYNSLLRSVGVKAKMVHGPSKYSGYHCWSKVLIDGQWYLADIVRDIFDRQHLAGWIACKRYMTPRNEGEYTEYFVY